jgi:hypothetical protein
MKGYKTPSRLRREGRNAFSPDLIMEECNPYIKGKLNNYYESFVDGWNEAKETFEKNQKEE